MCVCVCCQEKWNEIFFSVQNGRKTIEFIKHLFKHWVRPIQKEPNFWFCINNRFYYLLRLVHMSMMLMIVYHMPGIFEMFCLLLWDVHSFPSFPFCSHKSATRQDKTGLLLSERWTEDKGFKKKKNLIHKKEVSGYITFDIFFHFVYGVNQKIIENWLTIVKQTNIQHSTFNIFNIRARKTDFLDRTEPME